MSFEGLPGRAHQDRILHRVAQLLRESPHGLSEWTRGRIYVMADIHVRPDVEWPCILVASDQAAWALAIGGRGERKAGVSVTACWEERGHILTDVTRGSSAEVPEAIVRTLTADKARVLLPPSGEGDRSWGILRSIQPVFFEALETEREREEGIEEIVLTGRVLSLDLEYEYDTDLETGHPPGLTDDD